MKRKYSINENMQVVRIVLFSKANTNSNYSICTAMKRYKIFYATITTDSFHSNKSTFIPLYRQNIAPTTICTMTPTRAVTRTMVEKSTRFENAISVRRSRDSLGGNVFVWSVCVCTICKRKVTLWVRCEKTTTYEQQHTNGLQGNKRFMFHSIAYLCLCIT